MIRCLIHQSAIDEGKPLSPAAQAHLEECADCAAVLKAHQALTRARRPDSAEQPFLHARIMTALSTAPEPSTPRLNWAVAFAAITLIATLTVISFNKSATETVAQTTTLNTTNLFRKFETAAIENPLEKEIENLRADTRNAARALASSFLPFTPVP